ncbi:PadR family transcriptional regulator PadR [Kineosphaera limosa]|uniref:Putative PadR family transcriptional regulator n=1 Tax=Kineosphaera limosa NBRC 100340 TaxID=1184609 RepID=K6XF07_9MICO|nr:PadR family transcriptional regulator [Kineosphaera limosa]NYE00660.1 PadR family transcriptional regulator PadR [Kineosphaera limosa]GAB97394.1 putative PadR family transcriptional regulator [Kineosphaera limosa NBRC 100340]
MATEEEWPSDWLRGVLGLAVLAALTRGRRHGYAIAQELADAGLGTVKGGTLYPLLGRLEAAGHVEAHWQPGAGGPGRKVYALTSAGAEFLAERADRWRAFTDVTRHVIEGRATTTAATSTAARTAARTGDQA